MPLSEGVQASLRYKFYASGAMNAAAEPALSSEPGASGGRVLRRVSHTLNPRKNTYRSNEVRDDRQVADFRHGSRRVEGSISGDWSPATYFDFIEASHRDTKVASITDGNAEFTSVVSDNATSTFTFAGGNPVTEGYRVGDVIRFTNLAAVANNGRNFTITGFSGTNNRVVAVSPAPVTDAVADTSFSVTRPGAATIIPASGHVSRRVLIEDYDASLDVSRVFTECRVAGYRLGLSDGMSSFETMLMGRSMQVLTGASAPFLTAPATVTTTASSAAPNGLIMVGGSVVGVVTGLEIALDLSPDAPSVIGQLFVPEIFLGTANVTGTVTALMDSEVLTNNFLNEDEISILCRADSGGGAAPDTMTVYLPRIKFTGADLQRQGEGAQTLNLSFQAMRYLGAAPGIDQTTIRIFDSAAT